MHTYHSITSYTDEVDQEEDTPGESHNAPPNDVQGEEGPFLISPLHMHMYHSITKNIQNFLVY
jgi:hypothetical protein